jgi:single-strand DNA-binding protein
MANGMNKVFLFGNLGAPPELRRTQGGDSVLRLRVATNERYQDRQGDWQERTDWHTVSIWGKRAETLAAVLDKGDRVMVEGRIRTTSYEKNGATHYFTEVKAREIHLAGRGRGAGIDVDVDVELLDEAKLGVSGRSYAEEPMAQAV